MKKRLLSAVLCIALAITVLYTGGVGTLPKAAALGGVSAESLENYRRITVADIVDGHSWYPYISQDGDGDDEIFTVNAASEFTVDGGFGGKTYLDVDMNFGGSTSYGGYALSWQGNERDRNAFYLYMTGANTFALGHYDADQNLSILCTAGSAYGISNSGYFNVKLATNIEKASADAATETVTWRCWVNDMYVDGGTFSEAAHTRKVFTTGTGGSLKMRVPKVLEEELAGYEKISISDFKTGTGGTTAIPATPTGLAIDNSNIITFRAYNQIVATEGTSPEAANTYSLDKKYFDFDINQNGSASDTSSIFLYERVHWYDDLVIYWNDANNLKIDYRKTNEKGTAVIDSTYTYDLRAFGRATNTEFFNLKIRSDFKANSDDPAKRDAVIQIWINNRFADEISLEATDMRNGLAIRRQGSTNWYLRESKDIKEELAGYRRVDMFDYKYTHNAIDTNGVLTMLPASNATSYIEDFDKTYLDLNLNYNNYKTYGSKYLFLLGDTTIPGWKNAFYLGFDGDTKLSLVPYINESAGRGDRYDFSTSEYGISPTEYFNIKLRTDITHTSGTVETINFQFWINDKFACGGTTTFTYNTSGTHNRALIRWGAASGECISIKSSLDVDSQTANRKRVTPDDFENVVSTYDAAGCKSGLHTGGAYVGNASDLESCYLDIDVKGTTTSPILTWPSKDNSDESETIALYGSATAGEQLRFSVSGNHLMAMKVHNGKNVGTIDFGDISVEPYYYATGEFFNLKVITNIYGDKIGLIVFVNNTYLKNAYITDTYDAETIAAMNCLGIHKSVYRRTPLNNEWLEDVEYDLAGGDYTLPSAFSFKVNGTAVAGGTTLTEPGNYVLEYLVDGETTGYQSVSLYRWGDANADNTFDVRDFVRYKLYEIDQSNMNSAGILGVYAVYPNEMYMFGPKIAKMREALIGL